MRPFAIVVLLAAISLPQSARGDIEGSKQIHIDFTNRSDAADKATWSEPGKVTISDKGLGWDGAATSSYDGWIQTKPLALGLSWRPPFTISVRVAIHPKTTPYGGDVYVRYSPDLNHWSSWQVLQHADPQNWQEKKDPGRYHSSAIRVPYCEREEYTTFLREYWKQDVPWASDEEAAVRWILRKRPDFFSKHLPFIGYIEIRFEGSFRGGQWIKSFKADVSYWMSGRSLPPKDKGADTHRDSIPWRFKAINERKAEPPALPEKK